MGVRGVELTNYWEYPYAIVNPVKGNLLGHTLLYMQEVARPIHPVHHHGWPVAILVESELRAIGTF